MLARSKRRNTAAENSEDTRPAKQRVTKSNGRNLRNETIVLRSLPTGHPQDVEMEDAPPLRRPSESVCYGALCNAKAQIRVTEGLASPSLPWSRFRTLKLVHRGRHYHLTLKNDAGSEELGILDLITSKSLDALKTFAGLVFDAVVASSTLDGLCRKRMGKVSIIDISVNIIGKEKISDSVGAALADAAAYLQHPLFLEPGIEYINPQYFYPEDRKTDLRHLIGPIRTDPTAARIAEQVENLLESLDGHSNLGIHSEVTLSAPDEWDIVTSLKKHQEDGLRFILNREDPNTCDSVVFELKSLIGPRFFRDRPAPCLGGIIADVMGMGKTLTMLSAVACSKREATESAGMEDDQGTSTPAGGTLIVTPSRQVLDVWLSEIKRHLKPETLTVVVFHGDNRPKSVEEVARGDVVLTTYRTLACDWKGHQVLQKMAWFRVVLDEAHWIRNQSSEQFKAAESLQAGRRWCMTGTPIQNSLNDLRALLKFLHFQPFAGTTFFEKHIVEPIRSDTRDPFRNLRLLLWTICLRRPAIDLHPPVRMEEIPVRLTSDEMTLYARINQDCQSEYDKIVSARSDKKKYTILFTTILKLRRLCNHGTFQISLPKCSMMPRKNGVSKKRSILTGGDSFCEFCSGGDEDVAILLNAHEICPECFRYLWNEVPSSGQSQGHGASQTFKKGSLTPYSSVSSSPARGSSSPMHSGVSSGEGGYSSKLTAVVNNIERSEIGSKSLVFSFWRSTLDLLAEMLTDRGIQYLQIDGRVSFSNRRDILSRFQEDPEATVLLLSIETGAVGLTLTVANRVHIVEPQWNPSVEDQAIARVTRMGQTRTVTVFKYVAEKTVEQNIITTQKGKRQLVNFSLGGGTDDNATGKLDEMKFILDTGVIG